MNGKYSVEEESILDLMFAEECDKSINTVKTAFLEKAYEYEEKHFPSDDISNSSNNDIAFQSYIAGANWMLKKAMKWLDGQCIERFEGVALISIDEFKKAMEK